VLRVALSLPERLAAPPETVRHRLLEWIEPMLAEVG